MSIIDLIMTFVRWLVRNLISSLNMSKVEIVDSTNNQTNDQFKDIDWENETLRHVKILQNNLKRY